MSQVRGKIPRDRKRRSSDQSSPYHIPPKSMPATRRSPARASSPTPQPDPPLSDVLRELTLLRQSMEVKFLESGAKVDNLKSEVIAKLDANDQAVAELQVTVSDVTLSVDANQRAIQQVQAEVERREVELPLRVKAIVQEALATQPPRSNQSGVKPRPVQRLDKLEGGFSAGTCGADSRPSKKEEAYSRARRSLRLWPISKEGNLKERTVEFMVNELLLDQQHAVGLNFEVKRIGGNARSRDMASRAIRDEALVVFESSRDRDDVRSFAKNLERRGRGLRLEVPDHLWPSFRVLQSVGYELKQKFPALKRNVLFDDENMDLKLDVCTDPAQPWRTIYPDSARQSLAKMGKSPNTGRAALSPGELDDLLAGDDQPMEGDE